MGSGLRREVVWATILLGIGVAGFAMAFMVRQKQRELFAERPNATGDVGFVAVYAQTPNGPSRLQVGRRRILDRPQDFAFQFTADGTGPRIIRIELRNAISKSQPPVVMHEEIIDAPKDGWSLDYVLKLGDEVPDEVNVAVILDAPHTRGYESVYPIVLNGSGKR